MAVFSQTFVGRYGLHFITNAQLAYVTVLHVDRVGIGHTEADDYPTGGLREFYYEQAAGRIWFSNDQPFGLDQLENTVFVMWKT